MPAIISIMWLFSVVLLKGVCQYTLFHQQYQHHSVVLRSVLYYRSCDLWTGCTACVSDHKAYNVVTINTETVAEFIKYIVQKVHTSPHVCVIAVIPDATHGLLWSYIC